eukprot:ANDGO_05218.mRNA.1 hypothetical protein
MQSSKENIKPVDTNVPTAQSEKQGMNIVGFSGQQAPISNPVMQDFKIGIQTGPYTGATPLQPMQESTSTIGTGIVASGVAIPEKKAPAAAPPSTEKPILAQRAAAAPVQQPAKRIQEEPVKRIQEQPAAEKVQEIAPKKEESSKSFFSAAPSLVPAALQPSAKESPSETKQARTGEDFEEIKNAPILPGERPLDATAPRSHQPAFMYLGGATQHWQDQPLEAEVFEGEGKGSVKPYAVEGTTMSKLQGAANVAGAKTAQAAASMTETAKQVGNKLAETTVQTGTYVAEKAREAMPTVKETLMQSAEHIVETVGKVVHAAAEKTKAYAAHLQEGQASATTTEAASAPAVGTLGLSASAGGSFESATAQSTTKTQRPSSTQTPVLEGAPILLGASKPFPMMKDTESNFRMDNAEQFSYASNAPPAPAAKPLTLPPVQQQAATIDHGTFGPGASTSSNFVQEPNPFSTSSAPLLQPVPAAIFVETVPVETVFLESAPLIQPSSQPRANIATSMQTDSTLQSAHPTMGEAASNVVQAAKDKIAYSTAAAAQATAQAKDAVVQKVQDTKAKAAEGTASMIDKTANVAKQAVDATASMMPSKETVKQSIDSTRDRAKAPLKTGVQTQQRST